MIFKLSTQLKYSVIIRIESFYLQCDLLNSKLPDQFVVKIFSYFDYKDLLLVCKRWEKTEQGFRFFLEKT